MEELKAKITELRKYFSKLDIVESDVGKQQILLAEAHELMKEYPDKQEAFKIWTTEMTGLFDG